MNVPLLPVELVVEQLIHIGVGVRGVEAVLVDQMTKIQPVIHVHEDIAVTIGVSERHVRVQIALHVRGTRCLVPKEAGVDQIAAAHERYVPETSVTDGKGDALDTGER